MWLDRLPLNKDVLSQYIFTKRDFLTKHMVETFTRDQIIKMTAKTVEFIWKEAEVPSISLDIIEKAVVNLLRDAYKQLNDAEPSQNHDIYDLYIQYNKTTKGKNLLQSLLKSEEMNLLFDISPLEEAESNHFYRDQKTVRKLKNEKRLGQKSLEGDDVYWWRICLPKFSVADCTQHYDISLDRLPTELDVIKFVQTRLSLRKMSHSAGGWSAYELSSAIGEVSRVALHIWGRYVDSSLLTSHTTVGRRVKRLLEEHGANRRYPGGIAPIHIDGLCLPRYGKYDDLNDSYIPLFLESFDRQVFSALRTGIGENHSVVGPKHKRNYTINPLKEAEVEVDEIVPGPLVVPNFESLTHTPNFNALSWVSGENGFEVEVENCDNTGVIVEDPLSDHEVNYAREASTQTTCAYMLSHTCSPTCFPQL